MKTVGICGASGYSGRELIRILLRHENVKISFVTSQQFAGQPIADVFPEFRTRTDLICQPIETGPEDAKIDFVFLALPHTISMKVTKIFLSKKVRVIDLSGDFRLPRAGVYEKWYGSPHQDIENLTHAVYGLPEFFREKIKGARLVANPGCYPTAACLGLIPAIKQGWIDSKTIVIDAKSGVSGAGRSPSLATHFPEVYEDMKPYKVAVHQHTPEIERILSECTGQEVTALFVPHLIPIEQGMLCTIYGNLKKKIKTSECIEAYQNFYAGEPFVRILPEKKWPQTKYVRNSNFCDIGLGVDERTGKLVIVSAIDNMVKGASGQAIQNMNLMCGFAETTALL